MNLNKVILVGRLTHTPELKRTVNGVALCSFSVATNHTYKKDGEKVEETDFHNCVTWQRLAEIVAQYMVKGQQVMIEGRAKTRTFEKDGQKHYRTEIIVNELQMGMKPQGSNNYPDNKSPIQDNDVKIPTIGGEKEKVDNEIKLEDIPF